MKLSTKSTYGVRAMFDLALRYKEGPASIASIAEREEIPVPYLEQLFNRLRRIGLVESVRGPKGGYTLAKRPDGIRIGDIVRALEGDISPVYCVVSDRAKECHRVDSCVTRLVWKRLGESMAHALDSTTLQDLCEESKKLVQRES